jgi:hypothetical protein
MGTAFAPRYMGMSVDEYCADPEARVRVTLGAMERLGGLDGLNSVPIGYNTVGLSTLWLSRVLKPGRDLPPDALWQVQEAEVMTVDDYDTIIERGWDAFLKDYMPRVADPAELDANRAWSRENASRVVETFRAHGYVAMSGGDTSIPFEFLCGGRSMKQFFLDLYRRPDKVQAAMDVMVPDLIRAGISSAKRTGIPRVWVGGWRSASALVAPRLWERFVLPYFVKIIEALADAGVVSILHFDQDWTRDLARLREFPAKMCILNLDGMTDVRKAKQVLGDRMAIMGDLPAAMFSAGTPEQVRAYVRDLVCDVGPSGLILAPGCDAPIDTRPENMEAWIAACHEFGKVA